MASNPEAPKRKRSRPSDWWAANPNATPPQRDEQPPKKRGKQSESDPAIQEAPAAGNRGKVGKAQERPSNEEGNSAPGDKAAPKKKRGRPSNATAEEAETSTAPKKRGRPSLSKAGLTTEKQAEEGLAPKKKRGRPSLSKADEAPTAKPQEEAGPSKPRKRGRPSKTEQELEDAQKAALESQPRPEKAERRPKTSKKGGRRSDALDTAAGTQAGTQPTQTSEKSQKSRKGTSDHESSQANLPTGNTQKRQQQEADTTQRTEPRRSQKSTQADEETPQTEEAPTYQHLAEVTHRVARPTIEAKWESLPAACIERVSGLLDDIQRPVVVRLGDERRRTQASTALQMVSRRLVSKISKGLPFPQSTGARREDDFDFERILDKGRDLEAQLTLALHANDLLESELQKETAHLEAEEDALAQLEANAKIEASRRKDAGRKLHMLLQADDSAKVEDRVKDEAGFGGDAQDAPFSLEDEELAALAEKLTGHIDSIQGNVKQVHGITEAMTKSRAAVQATLFNHLESAQYEDIILG